MSSSSSSTRYLKWIQYKCKRLTHIPPCTQRKFENAWRQCYAFGLFAALFNFWLWSDTLTYVSGALVFTTHSLYFNMNFNMTLKLFYEDLSNIVIMI